jgi:hypothetical protein
LPNDPLFALVVVVVTQYRDDRYTYVTKLLGQSCRFAHVAVLCQVSCDQEQVGTIFEPFELGPGKCRGIETDMDVADRSDAYQPRCS